MSAPIAETLTAKASVTTTNGRRLMGNHAGDESGRREAPVVRLGRHLVYLTADTRKFEAAMRRAFASIEAFNALLPDDLAVNGDVDEQGDDCCPACGDLDCEGCDDE